MDIQRIVNQTAERMQAARNRTRLEFQPRADDVIVLPIQEQIARFLNQTPDDLRALIAQYGEDEVRDYLTIQLRNLINYGTLAR